MKRYFLLSALYLLTLVSSGQSLSFSTDTTYKYLEKTTASSTPPHEYFQLFNLSDDSIPMRWRINSALTFYPAQWQIAIQDNTTYHNPAPDSADFILPTVAGTMDKIILNLFHNQFPGSGQVHIDLFHIDFPAYVLTIEFDIRITAPLGTNESNVSPVVVHPNPSSGKFNLVFSAPIDSKGTISVYSLSGSLILNRNIPAGQSTQDLDLSHLDKGLYLVRIDSESSLYGCFPLVLE
jgi:hypothetical protein